MQYFECSNCGYVQTERPHWLDRAYADVINYSDTGILARNVTNAHLVLATQWALGILDGKVVDYAGGYGTLVRLLRDYGIDALWSDPFCANLMARGFEHHHENAALVTAFEAFEHFVEPEAELRRMLDIAPNVLLSTELVPIPTPNHKEWWYYGREHGQHIGLFRTETLRKLAERHRKRLVTDGVRYHLIADRSVDPQLWRLLTRARRLFPLLLRCRLKSRMWSDHLLMLEQDSLSQ